MDIVSPHLAFVNQQVAFHEKRAEAFTGGRQKMHLEVAERFRALGAHLETVGNQLDALQTELETLKSSPRMGGPIQLSLSLDEVKDLPDELVRELSISDADRTDFAITSLIDEAGGVQTLDRLIIGLYRKTGEIHKRQTLTNRLYRMKQKGLVFDVPGRKGLYATREMTTEEAAALG